MTSVDEGACTGLPTAAAGGRISHAVFRAARVHRAAAAMVLRETGLHPGQELLMMHLWDHGPQRQSELIKLLDLDPSTVSRMVQRLEQAGFVCRAPDPADRRAALVRTTEAGEALRAEVAAAWTELEERTVAGLDEDEQRELARLLGVLERNLCRAARQG
ncbi:MarR family winged helix-turn-helix transcriptional regulator [Streptomyces sp. LX-29]|uniref:MarR family winged helix-turn-helix transcriptional regulator n=1 Tax=Streptomyces sp. LX-29 TaxID=2900152 RepID=UPI00240E8722|nr:MarR family winged helix-turn-helix transcriptional regulator [Streptomyces sp. LX-29]WFB10173.1 MarR family winged helix-turn-helix transcriptional regulator [Streptomyces sp. LX-29]